MPEHYSQFGEAAGAAMAHNARTAARHTVERAAEEQPVHACPPVGSGLTPCCGRTPFELPRGDRMTSEPEQVTCMTSPKGASKPTHACPPGCPGCNAPGGVGECGHEDRPAPAPRDALGAPQTAEPPAPGPERHPGGENGPQTGTQRAEAPPSTLPCACCCTNPAHAGRPDHCDPDLHRAFREAITRQWPDTARFVMDDVLHDVVACHLDLVTRATGGAPHTAGEERRQRYADAIRQANFVARFLDPADLADVVLAVADAEQAELRQRLAKAERAANLLADSHRRAEQAETALARLHEGEELPTDERAEQTPGQWLWRWNHITPTERLALIARVQDAIARADRCFLGNHEKRIPELEEHRAALARVRALAERWQYTGDRKGGPLPELLTALAGQAGDGTHGAAILTVAVTAPTQENAGQWAATLRDLITAEHGDEMRLDITISPAPADQPERTQP